MPANLDFPMYFNIAFISVLLFGALFGFLRGFKKALYVFVFTLIFISVFFFTLDIVINFIYNVNMPFLGGLLANVSPDLASVSSLKEAIPAFLAAQLGDDFQSTLGNANFIEFVDALALFVVKLVYALLYFTIIQLILRFVLFLIRIIFFKQSKEKAKYKSKNRLMGALFGTLSGAISVFVTLIIFGGIINISESLTVVASGIVPQSQTLEEAGSRNNVYQATQSVILLDTSPEMQQLDDAMDLLNNMIDAYNNNIIVQGASKITIVETEGDDPEQLNIFLFDEVMSIEYQEEQIAFREELGFFAQAAGVVLNSDFIETRDISSINGQDIRDVFTTLSESNLLTTVIPLGIEVASDMFETEITIPVDELYEIAWDEEIMQLGEIAATVFDIIDAANLLDSSTDLDTITFDTEEVDLVRDLFDELGESDLINLAAYVAIEPVLEMAGTMVQSVITVPADINWGDEISAIGEIVATVLETGISIGDIQSGDVNLLLTNIASMDFTVILDSRIVTQALINVLSGNSELEIDLSYLIIPSDLDWEVELENILLAFNALASQVADIDFENLDITSLIDLDVEAINTIFESRILVATITDFVRNLDLGEMNLILPDSVFDEDGYLLKLELQNIVSAIHMAANQLVCDPGNTECEELGFDITKALTLEGDDIDTLLVSEILAATVGNLVLEMGGDVLTVPGSAKTEILVDGVGRDVVSKAEIKAAFLAISTLGITNIDDIEVDISILNNLALEDDPTTLDPDKADKLFSSLILNATLSSYLIDFADQVDAVVVVPYLDQDETPIRLSDVVDGTQYISEAELTNILEAILIIDLQDINNIETLDLGQILSNVDVLLESAILHATVSKQLLDLTDVVSVPMNDQLGNPLRITTGPIGHETEFIDKTELIAAFDALEILGITDINNVTIDVSILNNLGTEADPTILDTDKADTLFASSIINATLAKFLIDFSEQENAVIVVPELDQDGLTIRTTDPADGTEYIAQSELTNILEAILILDLQDFESIDTLSLDTLISNVGTLLESAILHATVSKQLLDLTDVVAVPMNNQAGDPLRITQGTVEFIDRDELELAFDALSVLGITDINNVAVDVSILNNLGTEADPTILDTDKSDTLFASSIITATISKFIIDFSDGEEAFIVVPYEDESGVAVRIVDPADGTQYISQTELTNILEAILILDLQDFDSVETLSLDVITDNSAVILDSVIMQASISKQLIGLSDVVVVPENDQLGNPIRIITSEGEVGKEVEIITETELLAAFDALSVLGITDINNVAVDVTILNNLGTELDPTILDTNKSDTLFSSSIITATISKYIIDFADVDEPFIVVPYEDENAIAIRIVDPADGTEYISQAELTNILEAILILDLQDFDSVETLSLDVITDNSAVILDSVIMQASISKQLMDLVDVVVVPENDQLGNPIRTITSEGEVGKEIEIISEAELLATFDALSVLGITDINNVSVDVSILNNLGTELDPTILDTNKSDTLFASSIITATISKYIIDFSELDEPFIVVPYEDELAVAVRISDPADGTEYISQTELTNILEAILILDLQDFDSVETLDLDTIIANANIILDSVIMQASISKQLIDLGDVVTVPENDQLGNPIRIITSEGEVGKEIEIISEAELLATFDALSVLGITDINNISVDITILNNLGTDADPTILDQAKADDLFSSSIITATLSGYIIDFTEEDDPFIVVPVSDELNVVVRTIDPADGTEYISEAELTNLLEAILILDLQDFDTVETLALDTIIANADVIVGSVIMQASISKQLIDLGDVVTVPLNDQFGNPLRVTRGADEFIVKQELLATFDALSVLGIEDINDVAIDVSILNNLGTDADPTILDQDKADDLFSSSIITATLSGYIIDFTDEDEPFIVVPNQTQEGTTIRTLDLADNTEYISQTELTDLLEAILILNLQDFNTVETLSLDVLIANNAVILGSSIMQASISKQFIDLGSDIILVPEYFEDDSFLRINIAGTEYIDRDELSATFESLGVLGIDNIDSVSVDISILKNLATEDDSTILDDTKATTLFASTIIKATVSSYILDFGEGDSPLLTIPYKSETDSVIINDDTLDATEYIVEIELKNILKAILALDLTDFNQVDTLELDLIMDNKTVILNSSILQATISQQIFDLGSDVIQIPYYEENDITLVRITVGDVGKETEFIARLELEDLLNSLDVLGITDINSFGGDIGFGDIIADSQKIDTLLASSIIQATITEQIVTLVDTGDDPLLIVPYESELSLDVRLVVGGVGQETEYITVAELKYLFDALNILGMGNIDDFGGTIDLTRLDTPEKITTLVTSSIIQATISKQVFDMAGDNTAETSVIVPYKTDLGDISLRIIVGDEVGIENEIIIQSEIVDLIEAFLALGYGDVNDLSNTINLSALADNASTVFASYIIQATVSKQVLDLDVANTVLVPYLEADNLTRVRNLANPGPNQTEYITKSELEALVVALDVLNVTNVEGFDGAIDIRLFYDQASRNTLLASSILQATITDQIIAVGAAIAVPYLSDDEGETIRFDVGLLTEVTEYIAKDEIHALFEALEILGMDEIGDLSGPILLTSLFASSNPGTYDDNQNTLLASRIMQATISDQISDLGGSLRIPTEDIDNVTIKTTTSEGDFYIYTAEIKHLINALDILGENDITQFSGNVSLAALFPSTNVNYATNQTTLLASAIIHATMTDQIFALDGDELTIPGQDFSEDDIKVYTLVASDFYIAKLEIKSLLNALDVIGFNQGDISDFTGSINIAVLGTENNQNTVLTSAIMHATISKQIFDLSDDVLIVPLYTQAGETLGNEVQKSVGVVDYIYTAEIKAIMNAFIDMGFTDLGTSIGSSISSSAFFDNPDLYLQSASIQATLSKKLFDINASETIIIYPDQDIRPVTPITIILEHADVTYIEVNELKALLAAMDEMQLTNFDSVSITPDIILGKDYNVITDSAIMQATVSEKVLSGATDELSPVNGKLIVPNYFREAITVDSVADEWIEQNELISLFGALEVLNITDFSGSVSASSVTNMSSTDLDTMLLSGSMHVTIDNMLKNNNNISSDIPDFAEGLALTDLLYNMNNIIVKAEVKAFIIATQQFAGADLSSVSFDVAAITSLTPAERDIVLDSMIVRNILTDELETMMTNDDPFDLYWPANSDYEQSNPAYFLTEAGINAVLTHYGLI